MNFPLAPIVLFVYNRPLHTRQTIEALLQNPLSAESELFIYSDGAKNTVTDEKVEEVRNYIRNIKGFRKVTIIERERNLGLANNIIDGVSHIVSQYKKIIVLEDDIIVSPVFLTFMNEALEKYEHEFFVWSISGWNYPIQMQEIKEDTFFWRIPHCWGWATWESRWKFYKRDILWVSNYFNAKDIYEISLHNTSDYWKHFILNKKGKIKTWAIFWYLIAYKHQSLTLMPKNSLVFQNGLDSSGTHCVSNDPLESKYFSTILPKLYPDEIKESALALNLIKKFHQTHKRKLYQRILNKLKRFFQ